MSGQSIRLYRTKSGCIVEQDGQLKRLPASPASSPSLWDDLVGQDDLGAHLSASLGDNVSIAAFDGSEILAPIGSQEVWAAGVTYFRSRDARMEESKSAGGGDFYDRVYNAERPELFFKSTASRVVGNGGKVAIRSDAKWSVPEPELAVLVNPRGRIVGYTIGNDMSSRDIEGENPLYLPQAKVYHRSCALGPCVLVSNERPAPSTGIRLEILRAGAQAFAGSTTLSAMKRDFATLVQYLYRDNIFPHGCILLTGTGIVPPDNFTLQPGDEIRISIDSIGTLENLVG